MKQHKEGERERARAKKNKRLNFFPFSAVQKCVWEIFGKITKKGAVASLVFFVSYFFFVLSAA